MSTPATVTSPEVGCVEAGEDVHERRLAGARRAHDRGQAALGDVDRDAAQGVDGGVALAVAADDVARGHDGVAVAGDSGAVLDGGDCMDGSSVVDAIEGPSERRAAGMGLPASEGCAKRQPRGRFAAGARGQARRNASTASTRRWSSPAAGRPSLAKMLATCFWTPRWLIVQAVGDRLVRAALGDEREHLALARGERVERAVVARRREEPRARSAGSSAVPPSATRRSVARELLEVRHAVLEQVAEPLRAARPGAASRRRPRRAGRGSRCPCAGAARGSPARRAGPRRCASAACGCRRSPRRARARRPRAAARPPRSRSAATSIPARRSSDAMPSRTSRLSSAITTRTAAPRARPSPRRAGC